MQGIARRFAVGACTLALLGGAAGAEAASAAAPQTGGTVVAAVAGKKIDLATVERWTVGFARLNREDDARAKAYVGCVRNAAASRSARCAGIVRAEQRETFAQLLSLYHVVAEGRRIGLKVSSRPQSLPSDFRDALRDSRLPAADRALWTSGVNIGTELDRRARAAVPPATDAEVEKSWRSERYPTSFLPRTLRAEVVELRTRADGDAALAAAQAGEPLAAIGGRLGSSKESLRGESQLFADDSERDPKSRPTLLRTLLRTAPGALFGPVAIGDRFYVGRYLGIATERRLVPLAEVRERVLEELDFEREMKASTAAEAALAKRWRKRTVCVRPFTSPTYCGRVVGRI